METIILIILAVVTLAAVLIFFFVKFQAGEDTTNQQQMIAKCSSICASIKTKYPKNETVAVQLASGDFCTSTYDCSEYTTCEITNIKNNYGVSCKLDCTLQTASCNYS